MRESRVSRPSSCAEKKTKSRVCAVARAFKPTRSLFFERKPTGSASDARFGKDVLHGIRRSHHGDLPLEDVGIVHEAGGETLDGVAAQLFQLLPQEKHRLVAHLVRLFSPRRFASCDSALTETTPVDATTRVT